MSISEAKAAKRPTILVVDDNEDIRNLLVFLLEKEGYELITANDGEEAVRQVIMTRPDLVLLDVMMPNVSGLEALTALRASRDKQVANVKVVMITAKSDSADVDEALARGADSYIVKPFRPQTLLTRVSSMLDGE